MSRTILSISASRPMNYLLQTVLSEKYQFISETDVYSGMTLLRKNDNLSLVIADVDNAGQDIWEFIEHISSSKMFQIPVLVLSSENERATEVKMRELGLNELIKKPFNPTELVKRIDEMLFLKYFDYNKPPTINLKPHLYVFRYLF